MLHCKRCYFSFGDQPLIFDNHLWKKSSLGTVSKSVCQMSPDDNIFICLMEGEQKGWKTSFFSLSFFSPLPFWCYCHSSSEIDPEKLKHVQNIIHSLNLEGNGLTLYISLQWIYLLPSRVKWKGGNCSGFRQKNFKAFKDKTAYS